jgi:L-noviosyl transferase
MRVLFSTSPLHGHFFPMVPLAYALQAAGHEVVVSAPRNFRAPIEEAGLQQVGWLPAIEVPSFMLADRSGAPVSHPKDPAGRTEAAGQAWGRYAAMVLESTLDVCATMRPDLVIGEPCDYASGMAAARLGLPWVEHGWGFGGLPEFRPPATAELAPELARLGLAGLPAPDLAVDVWAPDPRRDHAHRIRRIRYLPYNGKAVDPGLPPARPGRPRVCLTFGNNLPRYGRSRFGPMLHATAAALAGMGAEVVVALADDLAQDWPRMSDQVRTVSWLPLSLVVPECSAVVHHGGAGTSFAALLNGVPQLVIPQAADQFANAEHVHRLGAGRQLSPSRSTPEQIAGECAQLLADNRYSAAALAAAEQNRAAPLPGRIVPELEALATASTTVLTTASTTVTAGTVPSACH